MHRYLYAYSNPTVYIDLYGYESIEVDKDSNKVYWNIEKNWYGPYNPKSRQVHIGEKDKEGNVKLTQEFGGGLVAHEHLKKAASDFWSRRGTESIMNPADISGEKAGYQDQLIKSYIKDTFFTDHLSADWGQHRTWSEKNNMDTDGLVTRGGGFIKAGVGGVGAYATAGSVVALPASVYFADMASSGVQEFATGESHPTLFTQGVYSASKTFGASDETASLITQSADTVVSTALLAGAPQSTFMPKAPPRVSGSTNSGLSGSQISSVGKGYRGNLVVDRVTGEIQGAVNQANRVLSAGGTGGTRWGHIYQRYAGSGHWLENVSKGNAIQQIADTRLINNVYLREAGVIFNRGHLFGKVNKSGNLLRPDYQIPLSNNNLGIVDITTRGSVNKIFKYSTENTSQLINITY